MSKQQLLELAERVERLSGPCREVDAVIGSLMGLCPHTRTTYERCQGDSGYTCDKCGADSWGNRSKSGQRLDDKIPAYTASLDAAMALVPDTCLVVLKHLWTKEGKREWYATMNTYKNDMWIDSHDALNPLAAIAITAASLRAKAAMIEDE